VIHRLPCLESFTDKNCHSSDGNAVCRDQELAAIADNLDGLPMLRNLVLTTHASPYAGRSSEFPSMEGLLRKMKGTLELDHYGCGDDNTGFICAGLKEAQFLIHLHLRVTGLVLTPASVVPILGSLVKNRVLRTFKGSFEFSSPANPGTFDSVLISLLSTNTVLKTFHFKFQVSGSVHGCNNRESYKDKLLDSIAAGLVHNESLESFEYEGPKSYTAERSFRNMLEKNTTLLSVTGVYYPDIEWFLTLNRYKRRLLLSSVQIPDSWWTHVLERIAKDNRQDVLFHFLKRLPSSVLENRRV
jgi:hypothetical protein